MHDLTELNRQVEDLALQLVVGTSPPDVASPEWKAALERIHDTAVREQSDEVARTAAAIIERTLRNPASSADADSYSSCLQEGLAHMQEALDVHSRRAQVPDKTLAQDPELLSDFVVESREHLASIESQVLMLERDPLDSEALNAVFRGFHTIKGLAGFLELWEVQKLSHEVETVLDHARNSQWCITHTGIDVILQSADYLRRWLTHVESVLHEQASLEPASDEALLSRIRELTSSHETPAPVIPPATDTVTIPLGETAAAPPASQPTPARQRRETMAVKVDTLKLDYLVDMAGEMVIAESLVRHDPELGGLKSPNLQRKIAQLTRITSELQKTAMAMRLVPIGPLFQRMARLVRDLARQFGKLVELETEGDEIDLDRTIVEELTDPLMHMVRNALDHGIETPQDREKTGKSATARLRLKAHHQAGQIVIEISDDGRGLDLDRIKAKAIERGVITSGESLSDSEVYNLIFEPGFSTASQVTNVSGRGVGMDVVRKHIEKLRGRIEIRSTVGQGATFLLKLPLTLAIIDGLVAGVGEERYIIPLFAVREIFRPSADSMWTVKQRAEMALVRGTLLPIVRLYQRFGVTPRSEDPLQSLLVVAEVEGQCFCVLIDELLGKQEVVIKSLGETFQSVQGVSGGAILGDGRVGLILDLQRLFREKTIEAGR